MIPMRFYFAARYSRNNDGELAGYANELRAMGFTVVARWLDGNHQISDSGLSDEAETELRARFAREDFEDVRGADVVIHFTKPPRSQPPDRGGNHVEYGIALGMGTPVMVVGPRENVFHCLPWVPVFETWEACRESIRTNKWT